MSESKFRSGEIKIQFLPGEVRLVKIERNRNDSEVGWAWSLQALDGENIWVTVGVYDDLIEKQLLTANEAAAGIPLEILVRDSPGWGKQAEGRPEIRSFLCDLQFEVEGFVKKLSQCCD